MLPLKKRLHTFRTAIPSPHGSSGTAGWIASVSSKSTTAYASLIMQRTQWSIRCSEPVTCLVSVGTLVVRNARSQRCESHRNALTYPVVFYTSIKSSDAKLASLSFIRIVELEAMCTYEIDVPLEVSQGVSKATCPKRWRIRSSR